MKIPKRLLPLLQDGLIDEVLRPLMSGKEASVFLVRCNDQQRCAKVYKEAEERTFRQRAQYQEGRVERNSRRARAMEKRSSYGRRELEEAWQCAEVDALNRLVAAGVRVPRPYVFVGGVLLMELVADAEGNPAPRLVNQEPTPEQATGWYLGLVREVVRMLCAGLVHGDLSEYNVLIAADGPVIIDLPQALDAAGNRNAKEILCRDIGNLTAFFGRFAPELLTTSYGEEIWNLYERGHLHADTELTGRFVRSTKKADVAGTRAAIQDARHEAARRLGLEVEDLA